MSWERGLPQLDWLKWSALNRPLSAIISYGLAVCFIGLLVGVYALRVLTPTVPSTDRTFLWEQSRDAHYLTHFELVSLNVAPPSVLIVLLLALLYTRFVFGMGEGTSPRLPFMLWEALLLVLLVASGFYLFTAYTHDGQWPITGVPP